MVIAGGNPAVSYVTDGELYHQTLDVIHSDGTVCSGHDLPDLPENLEGFGIASKHDRYIYICGGQKRCLACRNTNSIPCFTTCGMYGLGQYIFAGL